LPTSMPSSSASLGTSAAGFDEKGRRREGACDSSRRQWRRRGRGGLTREGAGEGLPDLGVVGR
jgi:hypothetical protein